MSMISTALSGLVAAQRGLEATSNNVANAGTDGYVRRRTVQVEAKTSGAGLAADLGSGVRVIEVQRMYDQFLADALRGATSSEQRSQALADLTARLDGLLGSPDQGIGAAIQSFFDKVELLGQDPTSASNRQQLLLQGDSLAQRFRQLNTQLGALSDEIDRRLGDSVSRINTIAVSLAKINESIGRGVSGVNDLEDQRDALLADLASQIDANILRQEDGTVTVMIGSGQPLVLGIESAELTLAADQFDPTRLQVNIDFGTESLPISRQISGGALGGLLAFRSDALDPARRELGLLATSLASAFNGQHAQGADAYGNLGGAFFATDAPTVLDSSANTGSAVVNASIADATALAARDYELRFNGAAWSLTDATTGQVLVMTGAGTVASPFLFDGLSVTVTAGAAIGDRFMIRPVFDRPGRFDVAISDPNAIAAGAPVRTGRSLANASDASIVLGGIADFSDPALQQPVEIRFESPGTLRIYDSANNDLSGPLAYTSGADITFNGWTARISGTTATGDVFSVSPAAAGSGDNGNALLLAQVAGRGFLANGQISVDNLSARLVSSVGAAALRSSQDLGVQSALREQAEVDLEAVSGVNLDEEAANLLRYQQAYQAASKIIGISDELFRTLLGIIR
jgi:flagellar hook-associated protein 1 FlgK